MYLKCVFHKNHDNYDEMRRTGYRTTFGCVNGRKSSSLNRIHLQKENWQDNIHFISSL